MVVRYRKGAGTAIAMRSVPVKADGTFVGVRPFPKGSWSFSAGTGATASHAAGTSGPRATVLR